MLLFVIFDPRPKLCLSFGTDIPSATTHQTICYYHRGLLDGAIHASNGYKQEGLFPPPEPAADVSKHVEMILDFDGQTLVQKIEIIVLA
jgi:flagellar biosynthesis/type III secretory pathway ATPase